MLMMAASRVILAFVGGITVLLGLGLIVTDGDRSMGLVTILIGAAVLIAVVSERSRYRSADADLRNDTPGPGGGEPLGSMPPGFRATTEVFLDPASGRRMRVYLQPATGDRRYIAED
jgi:hypothetical protein